VWHFSVAAPSRAVGRRCTGFLKLRGGRQQRRVASTALAWAHASWDNAKGKLPIGARA
jgi:hypothetical protein